MKRFISTVFFLSLSTLCWTQSQYWTGEGGRGMRLTVYEPRGIGLLEEEQALLPLIQSTIIGSLSSPFSAMTVIDQFNLENIIKQQNLSMSGYFSDDDFIRIGHLTNAQFMVVGSITRIANNYTLELAVTNVETGERMASYPPRQVSLLALQNLSAVREASAQLLRQLGVTLTAAGLQELQKAEDINKIQGETAFAQGIAAQRQGTEIVANIFFYLAAALDPTLTAAAASRSSVISANIRSGNIGENVRIDIQWRNDWAARLTEFEEFFHELINTAAPPYTLFYFPDDIHRGAVDSIDYRNNTARLDFPINLRANNTWLNSIRQAANSVFLELNTELNATERRSAWQLTNWPAQGLTRNNPFASNSRSSDHNFSIVFELVNEQNRVIGSQTVRLTPSFSLSRNNEQITISYTENNFNTVTFNAVNANDISDKLTIRIASVNGTSPENARFPMTVLSGTQWQEYRNNSVDVLRIEYGIVRGFNYNQRQLELRIPVEVWGQSVTAIADGAFRNNQLTSITIPNGIISIGDNTFAGNQLTNVSIPNSVIFIGARAFENNNLYNITIGNGVISIGDRAFENNNLSNITIGNGVRTIGERAFYGSNPSNITIGANVSFGPLAFARNVEVSYRDQNGNIRTRREDQNIGFVNSYQNINGRKAGTYSASLAWRINNEAGQTQSQSQPQVQPSSQQYDSESDFRVNRQEDGSAEITRYSGNKQIVNIPPRIAGMVVTKISDNVFKRKQLTSVTIPNSVTVISSGAFAENRLASITLPDALRVIWNDAFEGNQLTGVIIPNSVIYIGRAAFRNNNLTSVIIGNGVELSGNTFRGNQITSITIGANVRLAGTFDNSFDTFYNQQGRRVGTYVYNNGTWRRL